MIVTNYQSKDKESVRIMESMDKNEKIVTKNISHKIVTVIGVILCIIFGFMLICNLTIIIKGTINPEEPPSIFGKTPLVVLSGSMSGDAKDHIEVGDLIFVGEAEPDELEVGDIISYTKDATVVTHRIINIAKASDGRLVFYTKGDANNTPDIEPVSEEKLLGVYEFRIPKVGDFAIFMQTPLGTLLFVGVPLLAFIIYDIIRRQRYAENEEKKTREMQAELERLRALTGEKE